MTAFHVYAGDKIPIIERPNGHRGLYNMSPDEIDRLRTGEEFTSDGDCLEPGGFRGTAFEDSGIERLSDQQVRELAEFQEREGASLYHSAKADKIPCKDQNGHGYCWCYGAVSALEAARSFAGKPFTELNPHSVASYVKRGRDQGGWASEALKVIQDRGVTPASHWPSHSRDWRKFDDPDIRKESEQYTADEWINIPRGDMPALRSLLAANIPTGMGLMWWGHLVAYYLVVPHDQYGWLYLIRNSHSKRFGRDGWAFVAERASQHGGGSAVRVAA